MTSIATLHDIDIRRVTVDFGDGQRYWVAYRPAAYSIELTARFRELTAQDQAEAAFRFILGALLVAWEFDDPVNAGSIAALGVPASVVMIKAITADIADYFAELALAIAVPSVPFTA